MKKLYITLCIIFFVFHLSIFNTIYAQTWTCGSTLIDSRDSKTYNTILIGTQCWMQQNLNFGTKIIATTNQTDNGAITT